jgi:hypothetical protein
MGSRQVHHYVVQMNLGRFPAETSAVSGALTCVSSLLADRICALKPVPYVRTVKTASGATAVQIV